MVYSVNCILYTSVPYMYKVGVIQYLNPKQFSLSNILAIISSSNSNWNQYELALNLIEKNNIIL